MGKTLFIDGSPCHHSEHGEQLHKYKLHDEVLKKNNFLSEFETAEEKALARHNLGLNNLHTGNSPEELRELQKLIGENASTIEKVDAKVNDLIDQLKDVVYGEDTEDTEIDIIDNTLAKLNNLEKELSELKITVISNIEEIQENLDELDDKYQKKGNYVNNRGANEDVIIEESTIRILSDEGEITIGNALTGDDFQGIQINEGTINLKVEDSAKLNNKRIATEVDINTLQSELAKLKEKVTFYDNVFVQQYQKWEGVDVSQLQGDREYYVYNVGNNSFLYENNQNNYSWKRPTLWKCTFGTDTLNGEERHIVLLNSSDSNNKLCVIKPTLNTTNPSVQFSSITYSYTVFREAAGTSSSCTGKSYYLYNTTPNGSRLRYLYANHTANDNGLSVSEDDNIYTQWMFIDPKQWEAKHSLDL